MYQTTQPALSPARGKESRQKGREQALRATVLTAVRQGAAEDHVRQQAPRGAARGTVHEAVFTVTAEKTRQLLLEVFISVVSPTPALLTLPLAAGLQAHNSRSEVWPANITSDHQATKSSGSL